MQKRSRIKARRTSQPTNRQNYLSVNCKVLVPGILSKTLSSNWSDLTCQPRKRSRSTTIDWPGFEKITASQASGTLPQLQFEPIFHSPAVAALQILVPWLTTSASKKARLYYMEVFYHQSYGAEEAEAHSSFQ